MGPPIAGAAAAPIQLAEVGEFGDIGPRVAALLGATPKVGELGPPIQVAASFGVVGGVSVGLDCGGGVEAHPGGGVKTSLPTEGCRENPTLVTSSPALAFAAADVPVDPAHVALGSFHTIAVLHEGQTFAPSGTASPQCGHFMMGNRGPVFTPGDYVSVTKGTASLNASC